MDYTQLSSGTAVASTPNTAWFELTGKIEQASTIEGLIEFLRRIQSDRTRQMQLSAMLYGNLSTAALSGLTRGKPTAKKGMLKERISYNVIASAIDTVVAKIGKNKPKPLFLSSGGDYKVQRRAKKLDKFCEGIFYENDAYGQGTKIFRDGATFGDGLTHVFERFGRVKHERVYAGEIWVDEVEAWYGEPRTMHREKNVDRSVIAALFPEHAKQIRLCSQAKPEATGAYETLSDVITCRESWHLPSGPKAGDGLRVMSISNGTLDHEKYKNDFYPFARFTWSDPVFGYWGQGAAERIQNTQLEINKLLWLIQRSFHLCGTYKVFLENGSKIVKDHLTNDIGAIINYTGQAPIFYVPQIVPPEIFNHLVTLKQNAFEEVGISMLSAAAQKPAGLDSGKALREYNDIESDRFMTIGQAYERYYLQLAKLDIATAKQIADRDGKYVVKIPRKGRLFDQIDWKDIDLTEDEYVMKVYPISSLPNDPEGRLSTIQEYTQAGFMKPRTGRRLLDLPDLEMEEELANSKEDYLHEIIEKMIEDGVYTPPEPFDDLDLALELSLDYYAYAKCNGVEEDKLDLLRQFNAQVNLMKSKAMAPPPMPGGEPAGGPQAAPLPPPSSDLLPNAPVGMQ
jgi:hypothetical protein